MNSEIQDEIELTYEVFKSVSGNLWAQYSTPAYEEANLTQLCEWGEENLPGGLSAFREPGAYQISFRACVAAGLLTPDPNWKSWAVRREELQREHNTLTAAESKARYFGGDVEYRRFIDEESR